MGAPGDLVIVMNADGVPLLNSNGSIQLATLNELGEAPEGCCCPPQGGCPLPDDISFSAVEIFGNAATQYTDATVPDTGPQNFVGTFGSSLSNEVWFYDDGAGKQYWFFVRAADGGCDNDPFFDTYGYDTVADQSLNNETFCCNSTWNGTTWYGDGLDTDWEAFP